jgi:hypothetical protein
MYWILYSKISNLLEYLYYPIVRSSQGDMFFKTVQHRPTPVPKILTGGQQIYLDILKEVLCCQVKNKKIKVL